MPATPACRSQMLAQTAAGREYALKVVLETCLSAGVVYLIENGRYVLDKAGFCVLTDSITQVNIDFNHDVCYQGLFDLGRCARRRAPAGPEGAGRLADPVPGPVATVRTGRTSWFAFDHYYSDTSFPDIMPDVFATAPRASDGHRRQHRQVHAAPRWPTMRRWNCTWSTCQRQLAVADTVADRCGRARARLPAPDRPAGRGRAAGRHGPDLDEPIPELLLRAGHRQHPPSRGCSAGAATARCWCMDTFWDRQRYDIASYCLINTSPYFTAMASGNSKIYESDDYVRLAASGRSDPADHARRHRLLPLAAALCQGGLQSCSNPAS